ncbi:MAG: OmpA family protein [Proteobacteria bacterium]|nr:OmpA family protein [Pseudomonadota bacterium]
MRQTSAAWRMLLMAGLALGLAALATADESAPGVTDYSATDAGVIEAGDIVEALAVPRGTRIRPNARPTVRLPVYFEFNSADLREDAVQLLEKVTVALASDELSTFRFSVEGHTDSVGSDDYNADLSNRRANTVQRFLEDRGIDTARLTAIGRGESSPVAPNDDADGRQRNRRVELINLGATP